MDFMRACLRRSIMDADECAIRITDLDGVGLFADEMALAFIGIDTSVHDDSTGEGLPIWVIGMTLSKDADVYPLLVSY